MSKAMEKAVFFAVLIWLHVFRCLKGKIRQIEIKHESGKNWYFRNREDLQNLKAAESVLFSLFMRFNKKSNSTCASMTPA